MALLLLQPLVRSSHVASDVRVGLPQREFRHPLYACHLRISPASRKISAAFCRSYVWPGSPQTRELLPFTSNSIGFCHGCLGRGMQQVVLRGRRMSSPVSVTYGYRRRNQLWGGAGQPSRAPRQSLACRCAVSDSSAAHQGSGGLDSVIEEFKREAYDGDVLAGSIVGLILQNGDGFHLCIKSLEVDPSYRRRKVGTMLVQDCLGVARREYNVVEAYVYVPTTDYGSIAFFQTCDFTVKERIQDYYQGTDHPDCFVLSKRGGLWWDAHISDRQDANLGPFAPDNVNHDLIEAGTVVAEFEKKAEWPGEAVAGIIACQVVRTAEFWYHLFIKSVFINEPYRRKTIGSQLLRIALDLSVKKFGVVEAFAYVATDDFPAQAFCEKSGFTIKTKLEKFYTDGRGPDCYVYVKKLMAED